MGEPITLHKPGGETATAYGPAQAEALRRDGWQSQPADAGGAVREETVTVDAPPTPEAEPVKRPARGKGKAR